MNYAITTNEETKAVVYPYEVSFRCFSEEFGDVLEGIAASPYSILVKTIAVEPALVRDTTPKLASAASMYEGLLPPQTTYGGTPGGGKDAGMTSRYGGGGRGGRTRDRAGAAQTARYGGGGGDPGRPGGRPQTPTGPPPTLATVAGRTM